MQYDPGSHHRRSIRLRAFDYRTPGCYAVTICTDHRIHRFGKIDGDIMGLSSAGQMVLQTWNEIPAHYPDVEIDAFVVMPNHVHGIIVLPPLESDLYPTTAQPAADTVGASPCGCPSDPKTRSSPQPATTDGVLCDDVGPSRQSLPQEGHPRGGAPTNGEGIVEGGEERLSLTNVVERFKSLTTHRYGLGVMNEGWPRYQGRFWQRSYYERVVRDERELERFRRYIEVNPARWLEDPYRD